MLALLLLMLTSKADDAWTEDGVQCRLYASGVVKYGINRGWPKRTERSTKRTLTKDAVTAVRTHKGFAECVAYACCLCCKRRAPATSTK